jgi:predicted CopG family antitoxin
MKTITLNEEAYQRLLEWKRNAKESFSQVVLNVVPKRGTALDLLGTIQRLPPLSDAAFAKMIEVYEDHRNPKNYEDAWTR